MLVFANLLGRLNASSFPTTPITAGAAISIGVGAIAIVIFLTYKKKWKWLWKEWLTSVDPKRIGVMYIAVALLMLVTRWSRCPNVESPTSYFCWCITWRTFIKYFPTSLLCSWNNHDIFCRHGTYVWSYKLDIAFTNWFS